MHLGLMFIVMHDAEPLCVGTVGHPGSVFEPGYCLALHGIPRNSGPRRTISSGVKPGLVTPQIAGNLLKSIELCQEPSQDLGSIRVSGKLQPEWLFEAPHYYKRETFP